MLVMEDDVMLDINVIGCHHIHVFPSVGRMIRLVTRKEIIGRGLYFHRWKMIYMTTIIVLMMVVIVRRFNMSVVVVVVVGILNSRYLGLLLLQWKKDWTNQMQSHHHDPILTFDRSILNVTDDGAACCGG